MTDVGISDMAIYIPLLYLQHTDLARARGVPPEKFNIGLGNYNMSILPNWEDAVTMAANAAIQVIQKTGTDPEDVRQLVVSTESGVDHSKPVASFVQGLLGIGSRCRVYEIKHACYGGTAGLVHSLDWVARNSSSSGKALIIMTDIARYGLNSAGEPTQGAGAIALLVEKNPRLLSINSSLDGVFSKDVFDFWRPTGQQVPIVDGKYSIECYLMALEGAVSHFRSNLGIEKGDLFNKLDYILYHMPFTNMAKKAHHYLTEIEHEDLTPEAVESLHTKTFEQMVRPGLLGAMEVGNIYTGSVYMGLVSLLEAEREKVEGKQVGLFSYGSGCGAEFMLCSINRGISSILDRLQFRQQLDRRKRISFEEYEYIYSNQEERSSYHPHTAEDFNDPFAYFIFNGVKDYKRQYLRLK